MEGIYVYEYFNGPEGPSNEKHSEEKKMWTLGDNLVMFLRDNFVMVILF